MVDVDRSQALSRRFCLSLLSCSQWHFAFHRQPNLGRVFRGIQRRVLSAINHVWPPTKLNLCSMDRLARIAIIGGLVLASTSYATRCPKDVALSCSPEAIGVDVSPCCVAQPGLFSYKQTWNSALKRWISSDLRLLK